MRLVRRAGRRTAKLPSLAARNAYSSSWSAASSTTSLPSWLLPSLPLAPFPLAPLAGTARRPFPVFTSAVAAALVAAIPVVPFAGDLVVALPSCPGPPTLDRPHPTGLTREDAAGRASRNQPKRVQPRRPPDAQNSQLARSTRGDARMAPCHPRRSPSSSPTTRTKRVSCSAPRWS